MDDNVILYATIGSDPYPPVITPKHSPWPNACSRPNYNVTDNARVGGDHSCPMDPWSLRTKLIERHFSSSSERQFFPSFGPYFRDSKLYSKRAPRRAPRQVPRYVPRQVLRASVS